MARQNRQSRSIRILRWALAAVLLALVPDQIQAFQARTVPELRALVSAVLCDPFREEGAGGPNAGLLVVDFDMAPARDDLSVAAGWHWAESTRFQYFAGLGAHFPDPQPNGLDDEACPDEPFGALTLGAWMGAGARWSPAHGLRLALEARWTPADITILGRDESHARLQTGLSLAYAW